MIRAAILLALLLTPLAAFAQNQTPAAPTPAAPPADQPSVRVGTTIFTDYTYQTSPVSTNADGVSFHANAFNLARGYVNITGTLNKYVAWRLTPDVARESGTGSSLNGSLMFRVKYAYAQFNLDQWMAPGSWIRLGVQQTPWLDFMEAIYRYRFQGTMMPEREGYFASADAGASFHYQLKSGYGEFHAGVYNGENYNRAEANDQKALMFRGTLRPFAKRAGAIKNFRFTAFYDHDRYVKDAERTRFLAAGTFEHRYANAAIEYLATSDQQRATAAQADGRGYSVWVTPKFVKGWEGLLRLDHLKPDSASPIERQRVIAGLAYWIPMRGATTALMLDYDGLTISNSAARPPADRKIILHALIQY